MSGAAPSEARIVVLGTGKDDPSLARLELLPAGAQVVAMGASLEDFASMDAALAEANVLMVSHTPGVSFADLFSSLAARMPKLAWARRAPRPDAPRPAASRARRRRLARARLSLPPPRARSGPRALRRHRAPRVPGPPARLCSGRPGAFLHPQSTAPPLPPRSRLRAPRRA